MPSHRRKDEAGAAFWGVSRSLSGRRWRARLDAAGLTAARDMAQKEGLSELTAQLLTARGVAAENAASYLSPRLRDDFPDPSGLVDCDAAVERLIAALEKDERVVVFGDYDADGIAAAAVAVRLLRCLGLSPRFLIPDRLDGYGPQPEHIRRLAEQGTDLLITVDCGGAAVAALKAARDAGIDAIVLDHHQLGDEDPPTAAFVNPHRNGSGGGDSDGGGASAFGDLSGVGVVFAVAVALLRALRRQGWFGAGRPEPDLFDFLDLTALGLVCDIVPLRGLARSLIVAGLRVFNCEGRGNPGLRALALRSGLSGKIGCRDLSFALGPRINAAGRMESGETALRLLLADDPAEINELAERLDILNARRRQIERDIFDEALADVRRHSSSSAVLAVGDGWSPGIVGIVASRLKERFRRPAIVIAFDADGLGRGSGRSVPGIDLGAIAAAAQRGGVLLSGGGHAMAAGFSLRRDRLDDFIAFLDAAMPTIPAPNDDVAIDAALALSAFTPDLVAEIERMGPFGPGAAAPRLATADALVVKAAPAGGGDHVRLILTDASKRSLVAMAFRPFSEALRASLLASCGKRLHCVGRASLDHWNGVASVRMLLDDAAAVEIKADS